MIRFDGTTDWSALSRREFLARYSGGIGGVALAALLARADDIPPKPRENASDLDLRPPHHAPRAKAVISLFQHGGPSHVDLFDPKPALARFHGKDYAGNVQYSVKASASRKIMASPWSFSRHGEGGLPFSTLVPHMAGIADEITVVRSMFTGVNGHEPSIWAMNTGLTRPGRPALGSWVTYALGCETQDLPAYLVLTDPGGLPVDGVRNWSQGWLPPVFQGTPIRPTEPRILDLDPPVDVTPPTRRRQTMLLDALNRDHLARLGGDAALEARIRSFELAGRMQLAAHEALDFSSEPEHVRRAYGLDDEVTRSYGERCLLARRLVERGVRFVQVLIDGQVWDNHDNIRTGLAKCCARTDKPSAALVRDLRERGLLDSTLVMWGGEIGRLPVVEDHGSMERAGRDHNGQGFTIWLAGGGVRGGVSYGETDDFGHHAVADRVSVNDLHATFFELLGLDIAQVTYFRGGRLEMLSDGRAARVIREIIA